MNILLAGILIVAGLLGGVVLFLGVPLLIGYIAIELWRNRERKQTTDFRTYPTRIFLQRNIARGFVILGGAFWTVTAFAGVYDLDASAVLLYERGARGHRTEPIAVADPRDPEVERLIGADRQHRLIEAAGMIQGAGTRYVVSVPIDE